MLNLLHKLGHVESASALILFVIAMPMKYFMDIPQAVTFVGTIHGVLFLLYVFAAAWVGRELKWPISKILFAWLLAGVPMGPLFFEKKLSGEAKLF